MVILDVCGTGLGDLWAAICHYAHISQSSSSVVYMSRYARPNGLPSPSNDEWVDMMDVIASIIDCLDIPEKSIPIIVDDKPNKSSYLDAWARPYFPTKVKWAPSESNTICYQFDGKSCANDKNPNSQEIDLFHQWAKNNSINTVKVGKPLSLTDCIKELSQAKAFVGACSGLSHVAISVGVPVYLLEYKIKACGWYKLDTVNVRQGMTDFIERYKL